MATRLKEITYNTRDLYEAGYLYAALSDSFSGLKPDGRDFLFVFKDDDGICQKNADSYYSRTAMINAKDYADSLRTCKDMIFARLRRRRL